jgi:DeoR/GlpR family transcriptional regulator of sugar metabolism
MLDITELKQSANGKYSYYEGHYLRCRKIEELLNKKSYTRSELAKLFSVSERTISRNLNDISIIVPIENIKGRWRLVSHNE